MYTIEQRILRGPNLFSRRPCVQTLADLDYLACAVSSELPGFDEELLALFPGMRDFEEPLVHGSLIAEVIGRVALELQRIAGAAPDVPFSTFVQCRRAQVRIVVSYQLEKVGALAVDSAMRIVQALCQGEHIDLGHYLDPLRASAQEGAIGASTAAVVDAAAWRGIPAILIDQHANLFQLGWGSRQKRLHATMTGDTSQVAVAIAADQQLTRKLLEQGGIPVAVDGTHIEGHDYRILVAGNKVAAAALRRDGAADVTGQLHPATAQLCIRAARLIGLDVAGIDLVCGDIAQPLRGQGGAVVAVNAAPGICMHEFPSKGRGQPAGDAIVEAMFGQGDGRIPVIAVTGTNGKTTTALMIAHCTRMAGMNTGVTTTEGVYINGERILEGDCAGYHSARVLLASPEVDIAVLETARGGILKRGLAFDRCSVAVVLNVSSDHLGLDGVETVEDMARVKAVVARATDSTVVLNADDRHCLAIEKQIEDNVERIYFSMEPENPVLLRHLEKRGRAAYFQDNALVLADGLRRSELLKAWAIPAALHGHARYNVANALAAAAALMGAGIAPADISAGLSTFVSDRATNPLRSNIYRARGVTIVVDYAHNSAAYAAMGEMARALSAGRCVAVVTSPGDRRDADLREIGRACAQGFDELFVYEADPRGREHGATAAMIVHGARDAGKAEALLHAVVPVSDAFGAAMACCRPGDVLVFACGCAATAERETSRYIDNPGKSIGMESPIRSLVR